MLKRWSDDVLEETTQKRLRQYREQHGSLPLAISNAKPEAKAAVEADAKPEADDIKTAGHGAPIVAPSRASMQTMHEYLTKAFNNNKILSKDHVDTWNANENTRDYGRIKDPAEKTAVRQKIQLLHRL